jgi:hypothetical protein
MKQTTITPCFSFNEQSLNVFDKLMDKDLGFQYEGTLFESIWIYRKSKNLFISIQVGFGGIRFVKINNSDHSGKVKETELDMTNIDSPVKLLKKLKEVLVDSK